MTVVIYSQSDSYKQHIEQAINFKANYSKSLNLSAGEEIGIHLIHVSSFTPELLSTCLGDYEYLIHSVAIADDAPNVQSLLRYTQSGVRAYCNAYMAAAHYEQLFHLLKGGQSWYPPALLLQAFNLARSNLVSLADDGRLQSLTSREKQIASSVAEGNSNKMVAKKYGITERTVKAHLTHIFEKLKIKDRVALVIFLKQQGFAKTGT